MHTQPLSRSDVKDCCLPKAKKRRPSCSCGLGMNFKIPFALILRCTLFILETKENEILGRNFKKSHYGQLVDHSARNTNKSNMLIHNDLFSVVLGASSVISNVENGAAEVSYKTRNSHPHYICPRLSAVFIGTTSLGKAVQSKWKTALEAIKAETR